MTLADLLIDQIIFLSTASDAEIHPDVAIRQAESLVAAITELGTGDIETVRSTVILRLESEKGAVRDSLAELLGMLE